MFNFYTIIYILYNFIQFGLSQVVNAQQNITVNVNEGSILQIDFHDLEKNYYETCGNSGKCESQGKKSLDLLCELVNKNIGNTRKQYINATSKSNVSADYAGNWRCTFVLQYPIKNGLKTADVKNYTTTFIIVPLKKDEETSYAKWKYIWSAIGILAVLIIISQTVCILHFKKKARRRKRMQTLHNSASVDSPDNAERYIKMPGQIRMEQLNKEPRESVIYEALENFPISKPEPPPVDTLPLPAKTKAESQQTSLTRKPLPTSTANRNILKNKDDTSSTSSLERIKARKPQPLPVDDPAMYEVMTPPDIIKKPESGLRRALPRKAHLPPQAVPVFPVGNDVPVLPSVIAASQLKPVNKPKQQVIPERKKTPPFVLNAVKKTQPGPQVFCKPPAPLPIQPIPVHNGSISSDEEEWTYEPLPRYDQYNIYDNVPR